MKKTDEFLVYSIKEFEKLLAKLEKDGNVENIIIRSFNAYAISGLILFKNKAGNKQVT